MAYVKEMLPTSKVAAQEWLAEFELESERFLSFDGSFLTNSSNLDPFLENTKVEMRKALAREAIFETASLVEYITEMMAKHHGQMARRLGAIAAIFGVHFDDDE